MSAHDHAYMVEAEFSWSFDLSLSLYIYIYIFGEIMIKIFFVLILHDETVCTYLDL